MSAVQQAIVLLERIEKAKDRLGHGSEKRLASGARYIRSLRNPNKRAYAQAYHNFLLQHDPRGDIPNGPEAKNLSAMGAQAVRMHLIQRHTDALGRGTNEMRWKSPNY